MKVKFQRLAALLLAVLMLLSGGIISAGAAEGTSSTTDKTIEEVKALLNAISYEAYLDKYDTATKATQTVTVDCTKYDKDTTDATGAEVKNYDGTDALFLPDSGTVSWKVNIPETALYGISIEYYPVEGKTSSIERIFLINGKVPFAEARYLTLTKVWTNLYRITMRPHDDPQTFLDVAARVGIEAKKIEEKNDISGIISTYIEYALPDGWTKEISDKMTAEEMRMFTMDIDNNEIRPTMQQSPEWSEYEIHDQNGFYSESFEFYFEKGEQTISLQAVNESMAVKSITLFPYVGHTSYENLKGTYGTETIGTDVIKIEAEFPSKVSSQTIYPIENRTSAANSPSDTTRTVLNTIGGEKWQIAGQWVSYDFKVSASGLYEIAARFKQDILDGIFTSRILYIYSGEGVNAGEPGYYNGIPCDEATRLRFGYNSSWQSTALSYADSENNLHPLDFYFKEGVVYTVKFDIGLGDMGSIVREVDESLSNINESYLNIIKLTGASPDENRNYGFYRIMPDTILTLIKESKNLYAIADELAAIAGEKSSNVATLQKVAWLLDRMGGDEEEIAKNLKQLKTYIGTLGTWLSDAKTQPLQLDYFVIQGSDKKLPKAEAGFFASFAHEIASFWQSFIRNYDRMGAINDDTENAQAIEVWLAYGRDQTQVIRNLINNDFSPDTGILVNLKLVAGGTLLPSILAQSGPDVYIGIGDDTVINYAIRGALLEVENYEGFDEMCLNEETREFNEAAMLVLGIADKDEKFHYYGLPETQNFPMMFVRTDILADLGIDIPKTWDDILEAIPVLQAANMEIGMPNDYKIFLYQMGGTLFADEGMRINLDSNLALESFETMCNMFTMYSFPYKYDFTNRFRTGEMPIGIASYNGTYNHLTVFATEIKGLWQFVPMPGIEDENGNINNVSVSSVSAIGMIAGCSNEEASWEFMKWHSGADCQIKYSNEMVAIIGPSAKHATANIKALESLPWTTDEFKQLDAQFTNLASIPNYPGAYIVGRYTKFAFLAAYEDNASPTEELLSYITTINKEITRKREEFDLETVEVGQTKADKRLAQATTAIEAIDSANATQNKAALDAAKTAIELAKTNPTATNTEAIDALIAAADALNAANEALFANLVKYLNDAATALKSYV